MKSMYICIADHKFEIEGYKSNKTESRMYATNKVGFFQEALVAVSYLRQIKK